MTAKGGDAGTGARDAARPSRDPQAVSRGNGQAADPAPAVVVPLGIDQPVRRVYNNGTTTTSNGMRRVWAAWIPADEYAQLVALLRGEEPS